MSLTLSSYSNRDKYGKTIMSDSGGMKETGRPERQGGRREGPFGHNTSSFPSFFSSMHIKLPCSLLTIYMPTYTYAYIFLQIMMTMISLSIYSCKWTMRRNLINNNCADHTGHTYRRSSQCSRRMDAEGLKMMASDGIHLDQRVLK